MSSYSSGNQLQLTVSDGKSGMTIQGGDSTVQTGKNDLSASTNDDSAGKNDEPASNDERKLPPSKSKDTVLTSLKVLPLCS
jgi:hypothetical protein